MGKYYARHLSNISEHASIGEDFVIHSHVWVGDKVIIGDRVKIQAFSYLPNGVVIGDDVFIGPRVTFLNDKHPPSSECLTTVVEDGASIGGGAVILPGVTIGEGAMVGAGSVVVKDVDPHTTVVGNPARPLRK